MFIPGDDVYDVHDPLGNQKTVHAARVRYYDGKNFKMSEEVKKVYTFNRGVFEVDKTIGLRPMGTITKCWCSGKASKFRIQHGKM